MSYDEHQGSKLQPDTENATSFHGDDLQSGNAVRPDGVKETVSEWYKRVYVEYHRGDRNGKWADQEKLRAQDNKSMFDAIAGQLELMPSDRDRGLDLLREMNLKKFGQPTSLVIFCLCSCLYNDRAAEEYRYHPNRNDENNPDRYLRVADSLGFSHGELVSVYNKVRVVVQ